MQRASRLRLRLGWRPWLPGQLGGGVPMAPSGLPPAPERTARTMFEREVNPQRVTEAEIVVVIPSYNEADSIAHPTRMADQGLCRYFGGRKSVIINTDNASPDGTEEAFLGTETQVPKIYITTPANTPGKGWNFANAFRKSCVLGARALVCVDADLLSITPEWMQYMAGPVLDEGIDYLAPLYARHKYDGTITNNICYPLIYGIFGWDIRQPIGGDFALSGRLAQHLVSVPWHRTTHHYGVDIFMTMNALLGDFRVAQVGLGSKVHKPSAPKLGPMFVQVVSTALLTVVENFHRWKDVTSVRRTPVFGLSELGPAQELEVDRDAIRRNAVEGFKATREELSTCLSRPVLERVERTFAEPDGPRIDTELWVDILFDMIVAFGRGEDPPRLAESMRGLYFGRVYSFMNETWELSSAECEEPIRQQGVRVFQRRDELRRRLEALR
ncbi:MAG TPA: glycosyltransferase [Planctomycetes bacterium]|nr:glycosyltransferase [Planctomycetota bacterium]